MAKIICSMEDCIHRSKRPMQKWKYKSGMPCYGCSLEMVGVSRIPDPEGLIESVGGYEALAHCDQYEPGPIIFQGFEQGE